MLIIYPTETCYGLGCEATDEESIKKIYELKGRNSSKPLIVLVNSIEMWKKIARVTPEALALAEKYWPAPLTIVQPKKEIIPDILAKKEVGVRWSPHPAPNKIINELKSPIVSTSANLSGGKNPYKVSDVPKIIRESADKIFDEGELAKNPPSTVIKIINGRIEVLRQGSVKL